MKKKKNFTTLHLVIALITLLILSFIIIKYILIDKKYPLQNPINNSVTTDIPKVNELNVFSKLDEYKPVSQELKFECNNLFNNVKERKIEIVINSLREETRKLVEICMTSDLNYALVVSSVVDQFNSDTKLKLEQYHFYEKDNFTKDILIGAEEFLGFKLIKWFGNGDFIFRAFTGSGRYYVGTYAYIVEEARQKLIEFCETGIAKGTSERSVHYCIDIKSTNKSKYLKQEDLP